MVWLASASSRATTAKSISRAECGAGDDDARRHVQRQRDARGIRRQSGQSARAALEAIFTGAAGDARLSFGLMISTKVALTRWHRSSSKSEGKTWKLSIPGITDVERLEGVTRAGNQNVCSQNQDIRSRSAWPPPKATFSHYKDPPTRLLELRPQRTFLGDERFEWLSRAPLRRPRTWYSRRSPSRRGCRSPASSEVRRTDRRAVAWASILGECR